MRVVKATKFGGAEVLVPSEVAEPVAGPGQVVVDVLFAPVLFLDTQIRSGSARDWFPAVAPPYVPGAGIAGEVAAVGQDVDPDWVGRRVVADTAGSGGYLERAVAAVTGLMAVPEGLGMADAAALLHDGRTALGLIEQAGIRAEEWVLVLGAGGGLGSLLVQLAHGTGARVIGAARGKQKLTSPRSWARSRWSTTRSQAGPSGSSPPRVELDRTWCSMAWAGRSARPRSR